MTCQDLEDALVDVARGSAPGPGSVAAVESHVEHCGRCAARLARERELTAGLRALAASTADEGGSAELEQQLLRAFADLHPSQVPVVRARGARRWLAAAAAAVVLTGAGVLGVALLRGPEPALPAEEGVAQRTPAVPPAESSARARGTGSVESPEATPPSSQNTPPQRADSGRRAPRRPPALSLEPASMEGFVALPAAAGLPAFESGRIIRIDVPVASLPAYGVDVIPDAQPPEVEADLLVGQDGQPRAIRLVTVSSNSRSRE